MNLADILIPKPRYCTKSGAESADCAEGQQPRGLTSPRLGAETCGKGRQLGVIRTNPLAHAETETRVPRSFPHNSHNPQATMGEIEKPLPVTLEYFRAQGVELLHEDLAFMRWHLPRDTVRRNAYIVRYVAVWCEAMRGEPMAHRKANHGRRAANTWLRETKI